MMITEQAQAAKENMTMELQNETHTCCRCGGDRGEHLDDGWLSCLHCYEAGVCDCAPVDCETCLGVGYYYEAHRLEYVDHPGQDPYWYKPVCCGCGAIPDVAERI